MRGVNGWIVLKGVLGIPGIIGFLAGIPGVNAKFRLCGWQIPLATHLIQCARIYSQRT